MTLNATQSQQATAPQSGGHTIGSGMQASVPFGFLAMVLTCTVTDSEVCCEEPALADKTLRHKNICTMNAICMRTSHEVRLVPVSDALSGALQVIKEGALLVLYLSITIILY